MIINISYNENTVTSPVHTTKSSYDYWWKNDEEGFKLRLYPQSIRSGL